MTMNEILWDLINTREVASFINNVIMGTEEKEEYNKIVEEVVKRLAENASLTHKLIPLDTLNSIPNLGLIAPSPNCTVSSPISPSWPRTSSQSSPDYDFLFMPRQMNSMDM